MFFFVQNSSVNAELNSSIFLSLKVVYQKIFTYTVHTQYKVNFYYAFDQDLIIGMVMQNTEKTFMNKDI